MVKQDKHIYIIATYLDKEAHASYIPYLSFRPGRVVIAKLKLNTSDTEDYQDYMRELVDTTIKILRTLFSGLKILKVVLTELDILSNNRYLELINTKNES